MYDVRPTGPKHRQRFLCELRVPGFDYVAVGNSTVKKDAQSKAARDFVAFLVRQGLMQARFVTSKSQVNNFQQCCGSGSGFCGVPRSGSGFAIRIQEVLDVLF